MKLAVERNDVTAFEQINLQRKEYLNIHFNYNMNIL